MPLFFNAYCHLWIAYLFFFNGLLFCLIGRSVSVSLARFTRPFESLIVFAFLSSIALNAVILIVIDYFSLKFVLAIWVIVFVSVILVLALIGVLYRKRDNIKLAIGVDWSIGRMVLYVTVFVVLFYNGGMIDQLTDAWWHMSLVNKMALESTFTPELGHLTSAPARDYPPLWHSNLALAHLVSGESIPVIWNSFTAWGAVLKVMAFYCVSVALSNNARTALIAAVLFVLLPGIGNSYLRVSAWPSHIAYTALYLMLFIFFSEIRQLKVSQYGLFKTAFNDLKSHYMALSTLFFLSIVVFFTHQVELLWFVLACFSYLLLASIFRAISTERIYEICRYAGSLRLLYRAWLIALFVAAVSFTIVRFGALDFDQKLAVFLPIIAVLLLALIEWDFVPRKIKILSLFGLLVMLVASINWTHFLSLFFPEMALPRGVFVESSSSVNGAFGGALDLPGWHLQLRSGLLYSGILSLPLSIILVILKPNQASFFLCGTTVLVFIFCLSPYLYYWLKTILGYHSPWRIAVLVFHPVVFALCLKELISIVWERPANAA